MASPLAKALLDHRDWLLAYILGLTRDHAAAEEIFQEVALAVLDEDRKGTRPDNFLAWGRELARRRVAAYYRQRTWRPLPVPYCAELAQAVEQSFEENQIAAERNVERQRFLAECLERLSERVRELVARRYGQQLSLREIASAVGWQVASVKVALSRARRALHECVAAKMREAERA